MSNNEAQTTEIIQLLRAIAMNTGSTPDDSYQFPRPTETTFQIPANGTYSRKLNPQKRLMRIVAALPAGVVAIIYKNGVAWRRYTGIFVYDDAVNGEYFNTFELFVQNTTASAATWNLTATFT